jgi:hypothetical protein
MTWFLTLILILGILLLITGILAFMAYAYLDPTLVAGMLYLSTVAIVFCMMGAIAILLSLVLYYK